MPRPNRTFKKVEIILTEAEYEEMKQAAALQSEGTVAGVLRIAAGLPEVAYGYKSHRRRELHEYWNWVDGK
jgi:PPE-repeat protein